jgi:hypothetical protein
MLDLFTQSVWEIFVSVVGGLITAIVLKGINQAPWRSPTPGVVRNNDVQEVEDQSLTPPSDAAIPDDASYIEKYFGLLALGMSNVLGYGFSVSLAVSMTLLYASIVLTFAVDVPPEGTSLDTLVPLTIFVSSILCFVLWLDALRIGKPWRIWITFVILSGIVGIAFFYGPIGDFLRYEPFKDAARQIGLGGYFGYIVALGGVLLLQLVAARVALLVRGKS